MGSLEPESAQRWRIYRIVAMAIAYVLPTIIYAMSYEDAELSPLDLFYPSPRRLLLVGAIGYQVFRLVRPEHAGPRTMVFWSLETPAELMFLAFGLITTTALHTVSWNGIPDDMLWIFYLVFDVLAISLLFAYRGKVVIDGAAGTVTQFGLVPRRTAFSDLRGLGLLEVHLRRGGTTVGVSYFVALFPASGEPTRVVSAASPAHVDERIRAIHAATGIPIARQ